LSLWAFFNFALPALAWAFPSQGQNLKAEVALLNDYQTQHAYDSLQYSSALPDGRQVPTQYRGSVKRLDQLPPRPHLGDIYYCVSDGNYWVWFTAIGAKEPSWIDP
jgi:hypothetical protein